MTNIIDIATKLPVPEAALRLTAQEVAQRARQTAFELAQYARGHEWPDFVKKRGKMVITPQTREPTDQLFEKFALGIRSDAAPETQINTKAWLGSRVATSLVWYHNGEDFDILVRPLDSADFVEYIIALAHGERQTASDAARRMDVYNGLTDDHPFSKAMEI
ncbi:hypothetical protein [Polaromonas sp. C04]|uniref:hypothetical protein n=1 Tax=Polaromonas sp. C04 TaxID=1945857 RepID=UPI001185BA1C|nr:hypothetical protein [Polaromonas sp. C04]